LSEISKISKARNIPIVIPRIAIESAKLSGRGPRGRIPKDDIVGSRVRLPREKTSKMHDSPE